MIEKITQKQIDDNSVGKLSTRPNAPSAMGGNGLNAAELRARFDALAKLAIDKINEILSYLDGTMPDSFASLIKFNGEDGVEYTLEEILESLQNGEFFPVDIKYTPGSEYPQSGKAVSEAIEDVKRIANLYTDAQIKYNRVILQEEVIAPIDKRVGDAEEQIPLVLPYIFKWGKTDSISQNDTNTVQQRYFNRKPKVDDHFLGYFYIEAEGGTHKDYHVSAKVIEVRDEPPPNENYPTITFEVVEVVEYIPTVDQTYQPTSTNPQSGKAVAQAIADAPKEVLNITSIDETYDTVESLPPSADNGTTYLVVYGNPEDPKPYPSLFAYNGKEWEFKAQLKPHTLYCVLKGNNSGIYRYTMARPYLVLAEQAAVEKAKEYTDQKVEQLLEDYPPEDGKDGKDGKDGVSPTVAVSQISNGHKVTITDASGQKSFDVMNGKDGRDGADGTDGKDGKTPYLSGNYWYINGTNTGVKAVGEDGKDGKDGQPGADGKPGSNGKDGTSVTVASVSESTADGGSNVVTFSDGKKITIKNGSKGSDGKNGTNGTDGAKGDKGDKGDTGEKGADGYTPVKGVDYYTAAEKAALINEVVAALPKYNGGVS